MAIYSRAQHEMFSKAASDPAYAKLRGISQDFAKAQLQEHVDAGSPELPDRATKKTAPRPPVKRDAGFGLLGYKG